MTRYSIHPLILCVLGLAVIGFFFRLVTEPGALLAQLLFIAVFAAIILFLVKKFLVPRLGGGVQYSSQAAPPVQRRSSQSNVVPHKKKKDVKKFPSRPLVKKRTEVNLTVIEGKKNKKKNRALF